MIEVTETVHLYHFKELLYAENKCVVVSSYVRTYLQEVICTDTILSSSSAEFVDHTPSTGTPSLKAISAATTHKQ